MPDRNPLPQRLAKSRSPTRSPACARAPCRCRARSTASASDAATPTWFRSSPNLQLKLGYHCVPPAKLKTLREVSMLVYELANITPLARQPYVGRSAFAHKGGLHVSGIQRNTHDLRAYRSGAGRQRSPRAALGALRAAPTSSTRARSSASTSSRATRRSASCSTSSSGSKALGYTFDGADASFELLMLRTLGLAQRPFQLRQLPRVRRQVARGPRAVQRSGGGDRRARRRAHAQLGHRQRSGQRARLGAAQRAGCRTIRRSKRCSWPITRSACSTTAPAPRRACAC